MFVCVACNVGILSAVSVLFSSYSATRSRRSPLTTERLERDASNARYWRERGGTFSYNMGAREKEELSLLVDLFPLHVSDIAVSRFL